MKNNTKHDIKYSTKKLKKRISYLKGELSAEGHLDGWTLKILKKELKKLSKLILCGNFPAGNFLYTYDKQAL